MNYVIAGLFLVGIAGFAGGFFTHISSRQHEEASCVVMVISALLAGAMIVLGIGAIAWRLVGG